MKTKKSELETYEVKYTGYLSNSSDVFLHYGYANWSDISECKMKKLKNCYKTEVSVPSGSNLNFCFRNESGYWDNNYGNDYCYVPGHENNEYSNVEICGKCSTSTSGSTLFSTTLKKAKTCTTGTVGTEDCANSIGTTDSCASYSADVASGACNYSSTCTTNNTTSCKTTSKTKSTH